MRILVACEFSGIVRDAFTERGHDAWSCDLLPSERPGQHILGDVNQVLSDRWDMMLAFPPCTHICRSGQWRWSDTPEMYDALQFVRLLMAAPIAKIALENPIGRISTYIRRPDQIIQPWQFGHGETKATCLWLKGLPPLRATDTVADRDDYIARLPDSKRRQRLRQLTYTGIANAMAQQWG